MKRLIQILSAHEKWRKNCLNLIASENVMSPLAQRFYCSDLMHRYAEGLPRKRYYQGLKYFDQLETLVTNVFKKHFKCNFVDLRPISGAIANLAVFSALGERGDKVLTLGIEGGSHISHEAKGTMGIVGLRIYHFPLEKEGFLDVEGAKSQILKIQPKFIVLGASVFLFPHPIKELKSVCQKVGAKIVYDAAHVFGLVFNGLFQRPLEEGVDIITASTHKTFPGPQGGIILGNIDEELAKKIRQKIFPGLISNHHLHRLPSLYITFLEMKKFGKKYGEQTIRNAKTLARKLFEYGFDVLGKERGFTQSHQVLLNVENFGGGDKTAKILEKANIIVNKNRIYKDQSPIFPSGIRIGVQEMTRFGMKEKEMEQIAHFFKKLLIDKEQIKKVKNEVIEFRKKFQKLKYCFA